VLSICEKLLEIAELNSVLICLVYRSPRTSVTRRWHQSWRRAASRVVHWIMDSLPRTASPWACVTRPSLVCVTRPGLVCVTRSATGIPAIPRSGYSRALPLWMSGSRSSPVRSELGRLSKSLDPWLKNLAHTRPPTAQNTSFILFFCMDILSLDYKCIKGCPTMNGGGQYKCDAISFCSSLVRILVSKKS